MEFFNLCDKKVALLQISDQIIQGYTASFFNSLTMCLQLFTMKKYKHQNKGKQNTFDISGVSLEKALFFYSLLKLLLTMIGPRMSMLNELQ